MTKREIAIAVAKKLKVTQKTAAEVLDALIDEMKSALGQGERIEIRDFGVFSVRDAKKKKARNPRTNEVVIVPARKRIKFVPGKRMKELAQRLSQ
ncbi:MAG: DNA-binding protein [Candidatus Coatesbacteria bacterium]|nr:DNA-binding protein [Candidatus Coatesbacteria bacterium]